MRRNAIDLAGVALTTAASIVLEGVDTRGSATSATGRMRDVQDNRVHRLVVVLVHWV